MAYAFLGSCLFYRLNIFKDLTWSFLSLFSIMMGDSLLESAKYMNQESRYGYAYFFSFLFVFLLFLHNVLISVVCSKTKKLNEHIE